MLIPAKQISGLPSGGGGGLFARVPSPPPAAASFGQLGTGAGGAWALGTTFVNQSAATPSLFLTSPPQAGGGNFWQLATKPYVLGQTVTALLQGYAANGGSFALAFVTASNSLVTVEIDGLGSSYQAVCNIYSNPSTFLTNAINPLLGAFTPQQSLWLSANVDTNNTLRIATAPDGVNYTLIGQTNLNAQPGGPYVPNRAAIGVNPRTSAPVLLTVYDFEIA